ncbi:MAG: J domain-containing protein [Henriciella sp.]|nr:J domain-containing protein [Henriciella sp.]
MSKDYEYRPKFTDIRVKPPADETSRAKAQKTRVCDYAGCDLPGEYPAPMQFGDGKHWFCKRHAAEYNKSFNFFDTMTDEQLKAFRENSRYGFSPTWKMGSGPMGGAKAGKASDPRTWKGAEFFDNREAAREARRGNRSATGVAKRALAELDLDADAKPPEIRTRYAEYVRRFHPDSNSGDRSSEEKLAKVIRAGKTLKAAGLMKD